MKRGQGWIVVVALIVMGTGMLYGAPDGHGDLVIDKKGTVQYTPLDTGKHDIDFGGKGRLSFDAGKVITESVSSTKLRTTETAKKSVFGASIEVRSLIADRTTFPTGEQSFQAQGRAFHFEPEGLFFESPATLTLPYESIEGIDDSRIDIYYYNEENSMWEVEPKVSQDKENKTITVEINHFSDYVAGMSSFRIDEGGSINAGGQLSQDVDPYFGTLNLKSDEVSVGARGVNLTLNASFNSDYLYKKYVSVFSGIHTTIGTENSAGRTLVKTPELKYPFAGTDISSGWSYAMPYAQFDTYNRLYLTLPSGAFYDLSAFAKSWVTMSVDHVENNGAYRINKPASNQLKILIPEADCGLLLTLNNVSTYFLGIRLSTRGQVTSVNLCNADASYWQFPSSGNVQYLYDASGKNRLAYGYASSGALQSISHSDGRAIKIYSYTNSSGTTSLVYVLSSSTSMTTLNAEDQFIARRVLDNTGRLQYADRLQTAASITPSTTWGGITSANESSYFSVLQRTTYTYSMSSTVTGNTFAITEPGGGYRQYTFGISFFPGIHSEKITSVTTGHGEESDTYDVYYEYYHNKPKVEYAVTKTTSASTNYEKKTYSYFCSDNHGTCVYTSSSYDQGDYASPAIRNTSPESAQVLGQKEIGSNANNITKEIIGYSYADGTYQGVGQDDIQYYISSAWVSKTKTVTAFWSSDYYFYKPATETVYKNGSTTAAWTITSSYDGYGRIRQQTDSRTEGSTYWYYLYYGTAGSVGFSYPFTIPDTMNKYFAFGLIGGIASQQTSSVTSMTYFGYDSLMNVTTKRIYDTRNGATVELNTGSTYDATTNVLTGISYPALNTLSLSYGTGWKSSYITKDSRSMDGATNIVNVFDYDLLGRTTSVTPKLVSSSNGTDIYDAAAPIVTTGYVYDGLGRVKSKSITTSGVTTEQYRRVYDDTNLTVTTTDAKGYRTVVGYDAFFRKTVQEQFRPSTETQGVSYDGTGQVSIAKTAWTYDPVYRDNILTEAIYASSDGANGYCTWYTYDTLGRLTNTYQWNIDYDFLVAEYSYNDTTNTITEKHHRGDATYTQSITTKDWLDRMTSVTQYSSVGGMGTASTTSTTYNYASQPISKTLANGEVYQYTYSRAGLLESIVYPQNRGIESYTYNYNGRLTSKTDVGGNATSYTYNAADLETYRISSATYKEPIAVLTSYTQYGPKQVSQLRNSIQELLVNYAYSYTAGALTATETRQIISLGGTSSVSHGYDVAGNLRTLTVEGFGSTPFTKTLDYSLPFFGGDGGTTDRWMRVSTAGATLGKVSTNYSGLRNVVQYGNQVAEMVYQDYDDFMRPAQMDYPGAAYDQNYTYDWQGNIASWNGASYTYDGMDRLATDGYAYDVIGNQITAPNSMSYTYIASGVQPSMRLDYKTVNGVPTDYADDGNLANMVSVAENYSNLTYDPTNRLISINDVVRGVTDSYRYGPEGLRYKKVEAVLNGTSKTTYYLYEGNDILYEEGYEGSTRTFSKLNVFVGGVNVGRVRKEGSTESVQYFFMDHLGSRRAVLDSTGAVQAKIDYNVWGVPTVTPYNGYEGSLDVSYTGKEQDATKLYYFNARYYDASIGRFITEDPARNGMNWFAYCGNNPLRFTDPSGLDVGNAGNDGFDENGNPVRVTGYNHYTNGDDIFITITTKAGNPTNEEQRESMAKNATKVESDIILLKDKKVNGCKIEGDVPQGFNLFDNLKKVKGMSATQFFNIVRLHGIWDYKKYSTNDQDYQNFGNWHYGVIGRAWGWGRSILQRMAGWAQTKGGNGDPAFGSPLGGYPYGDDPNDQQNIILGMNFYDSAF